MKMIGSFERRKASTIFPVVPRLYFEERLIVFGGPLFCSWRQHYGNRPGCILFLMAGNLHHYNFVLKTLPLTRHRVN